MIILYLEMLPSPYMVTAGITTSHMHCNLQEKTNSTNVSNICCLYIQRYWSSPAIYFLSTWEVLSHLLLFLTELLQDFAGMNAVAVVSAEVGGFPSA